MSDIRLLEQIKSFTKPHCYQYQKRLDTLEEDKEKLGWDDEFISNIDLNEFEFSFVDNKQDKEEAIEFIKRYEWLGTTGSYPTHFFIARYRGILGGVIIMGMPNAFSKLLGDETKSIERLIARARPCRSRSDSPDFAAQSRSSRPVRVGLGNQDFCRRTGSRRFCVHAARERF